MTRALAPRFWPAHLLLLALVAAAAALGQWQFNGWQAQREVQAVDLTRGEPVELSEVMGPDEPFPADAVGQPVTLGGTWVPQASFFVADRERAGQEGYWAVTPLAIDGADGPALLIVRGWIDDPARSPDPPTGDAELVAWLQPPEGTAGVSDDDPSDDVLPQLRIADAIQRVDQDLYGAYAVAADRVADGEWPVGDAATNPGTDGLEQVSPEEAPQVGQFTALRNFLYGIQWWLFGAFAVFVWWQWMRDQLRAEAVIDD